MITAQAELPLDGPGPMPDLVAEGGAWFAAWLAAHPKGPAKHGAWPGREICRRLGRPWNEANRRKIRAFRESAGSIIISGPAGYQHVMHCPLDARKAAAKIRLAQGRKMADEALRELNALAMFEHLSAT